MLRRVIIFSIWLMPMGISAGDWTVSRGVTVKETYTDNHHLEASDKESEWITEIRPAVGLHGKGGRIQADLDYSLDYVNYAGDFGNKVYHQLRADSKTELTRNHFFMDASASVGQSLIDSLGRSGNGVVNRTGNLETTSTYTINPYYTTRLGNYAAIKLGYTNDGVFHSESGDDSVANTVSAEVTSGSRFQKTPWSISARNERVNYSDSDDKRYKSVNGRLGYVFDRQWRIDGSVGYEDNTYTRTVGSDNDGTRWDARVIWTPNPRTSLTVGTGHRYIGKTPTLDFSHRSKRTTWKASYRKDVSDFRTVRLSGINIWRTERVGTDAFGNPIYALLFEDDFGNPTKNPASGIPYIDTVFLPSIGPDTFISERFQTSMSIDGNRSNLGISAFYEQREYEVSTKTEDVLGVSLHGSHKITGQTSATANLSWERDEQTDDPLNAQDLDITTWRAGVGLSRPLSTHLRGNVQYQYNDRDSNVADDNYSENRLWVSVSANWK